MLSGCKNTLLIAIFDERPKNINGKHNDSNNNDKSEESTARQQLSFNNSVDYSVSLPVSLQLS